MKTSELTLNQLSYAVSMLEVKGLTWGETIGLHHASKQVVIPSMDEPDCYSPFTTWKMCGPIIEREKLSLASPSPIHGHWTAMTWCNASKQDGPTALIAAMRCYVASKLGDEVKIPEELSHENI